MFFRLYTDYGLEWIVSVADTIAATAPNNNRSFTMTHDAIVTNNHDIFNDSTIT